MIMENVFLSQNGQLTSTESNFLANMSSELIKEAQERLNSVKFYKISVASISGGEKQLMTVGNTSMDFIEEDLKKIAEMNSFCAWIREAIKSKEQMSNDITNVNLEDWAEANGIKLPDYPDYPNSGKTVREEDIIDCWDINKRNKYLRLEAFASTYGKYIHPKGAFSNARKEAHAAKNTPIYKEGSGRDLILYYQEPTINTDEIDSKFMELQSIYRNYEKELNSMKADLKNEVNRITLEKNQKYQEKLAEYKVAYDNVSAKISEIRTKFNSWKTSELEKVSKLKIVIPDNLMSIYSEIKEKSNSK